MKNNNKGFSLIELIVSVALMSIIMIIATGMLTSAARYFEKQSAMVELQNEAQLVTNYLSEAIMEASAMEITTDAAGNGTYKLYKTDSKGNQRIMYFDQATTSLYMVTFKDNLEPGSASYADTGFLVSDEVQSMTLSFDYGVETSPEEIAGASEEAEDGGVGVTPGEPAEPGDPEEPTVYVVRNPLKVKIVFEIVHGKASSEFEISASCRNTLDEVVVNNADGTSVTYKAYNR